MKRVQKLVHGQMVWVEILPPKRANTAAGGEPRRLTEREILRLSGKLARFQRRQRSRA